MTDRYVFPSSMTGSEENPETIDFFDLILGLSTEQRFRGRTGDPGCTVLRHSVLCATIARLRGEPAWLTVFMLFHDFHEGLTTDMPSPLKKQIPGWGDYEGWIERTIRGRLGVGSWDLKKEDLDRIRLIDQIALACDILWSIKRHGNPTPLSAYTIDPGAIEEAKRMFPCLA